MRRKRANAVVLIWLFVALLIVLIMVRQCTKQPPVETQTPTPVAYTLTPTNEYPTVYPITWTPTATLVPTEIFTETPTATLEPTVTNTPTVPVAEPTPYPTSNSEIPFIRHDPDPQHIHHK